MNVTRKCKVCRDFTEQEVNYNETNVTYYCLNCNEYDVQID